MKRRFQEIFLALLFGLGVPALVFSVMLQPARPLPRQPATTGQAVQPPAQMLRLLTPEGSRELPVEEYLVGVLLRELPGDFHIEAKKAQATAARTYTLRAIGLGVKHPVGSICSDPACCQAYVDPAAFSGDAQTLAQARQAVQQTAGQVIVFDDTLIDATYFACSGGRTEDAVAVWGSDIPYLQSVASPGEEAAAYYTDTVQMKKPEFFQRLGMEALPTISLDEIRRTQGGGIESVKICGKTFTGTQLRTALGLRSTALTITALGDTVTITTRGFGHRVGLSQQGANAMAFSGSDYREILTHYYTGTEICDYDDLI